MIEKEREREERQEREESIERREREREERQEREESIERRDREREGDIYIYIKGVNKKKLNIFQARITQLLFKLLS